MSRKSATISRTNAVANAPLTGTYHVHDAVVVHERFPTSISEFEICKREHRDPKRKVELRLIHDCGVDDMAGVGLLEPKPYLLLIST